MSEFMNDPYHRSAPAEHSLVVEHLSNAGALIVDSFTIAAQGVIDVARNLLQRQSK